MDILFLYLCLAVKYLAASDSDNINNTANYRAINLQNHELLYFIDGECKLHYSFTKPLPKEIGELINEHKSLVAQYGYAGANCCSKRIFYMLDILLAADIRFFYRSVNLSGIRFRSSEIYIKEEIKMHTKTFEEVTNQIGIIQICILYLNLYIQPWQIDTDLRNSINKMKADIMKQIEIKLHHIESPAWEEDLEHKFSGKLNAKDSSNPIYPLDKTADIMANRYSSENKIDIISEESIDKLNNLYLKRINKEIFVMRHLKCLSEIEKLKEYLRDIELIVKYLQITPSLDSQNYQREFQRLIPIKSNLNVREKNVAGFRKLLQTPFTSQTLDDIQNQLLVYNRPNLDENSYINHLSRHEINTELSYLILEQIKTKISNEIFTTLELLSVLKKMVKTADHESFNLDLSYEHPVPSPASQDCNIIIQRKSVSFIDELEMHRNINPCTFKELKIYKNHENFDDEIF